MDDFSYQEVKVVCSNCGKELKIITYGGFDTADYLCPKCSVGEAYFEEESDI
ncbi:hypothetical protein JW930_06275 [Candidatus Woesearchaeota archaeon]|nr:hypothetical protein [Candidatus Woesearchaeota archaeon]